MPESTVRSSPSNSMPRNCLRMSSRLSTVPAARARISSRLNSAVLRSTGWPRHVTGAVGRRDGKFAKDERVVARRHRLGGRHDRRRTAQQRAGPGDEQARLDGLEHVVVGADFQSGHLVVRVDTRSQDQHRHARERSDAPAHFHAVHVRQHQVEDHQRGLVFTHGGHGNVAAAHDFNCKFIVAQVFADKLCETVVVFDQQHLGLERRVGHRVHRPYPPFLLVLARSVRRPPCERMGRRNLQTLAHNCAQLRGNFQTDVRAAPRQTAGSLSRGPTRGPTCSIVSPPGFPSLIWPCSPACGCRRLRCMPMNRRIRCRSTRAWRRATRAARRTP